jgi:hypothetical protein
MANKISSLPENYWQEFSVTKKDIELIQNYLFETETPLPSKELVKVVVEERLEFEKQAAAKKLSSIGTIYLPKGKYLVDESLAFPAINWQKGVVTSTRPGKNPEVGTFSVIEVAFEDGERKFFAAEMENHELNAVSLEEESEEADPQGIIEEFGDEIENKISIALTDDETLVNIAGHWFPKALLLDVSVGHLNLVEAILEMAAGEPMASSSLIDQIDLGAGVNAKLAEFSLNYALQEDKRFDEVGPSGQILWVLERLEPEEVRNCPHFLKYIPVEYDETCLTPQMLALDSELDDELKIGRASCRERV